MLDGAAVGTWVVLATAQAAAGDNGTAHPNDELIIVTGERVARPIRDTASSVDVFTADRMDKTAGADRIEQVLALVSNVQISSGGEGPTIRGQDTTGATRDLPAFLGGNRPRTTLVVDGRPVSFNEFVFGVAPLWDVSRIEVFRSPQTTTQGQNSIAGAIFVETSDPVFISEFRARASAGDFRTRQVSIAGTGPLTNDIAIRLAGDFRYSSTSSWMSDRARGADPNHDVYGLLRVKLLAKPKVLPGATFGLTYSHSQSQMPQVEGVRLPFERRVDKGATYGVFRNNIDALTARGDIPLSTELAWKTVVTGGDSHIQRFAPAGLGEARTQGRDWSAESILNWSPDFPIKGTVGVSYRKATLKQRIDLSQLAGIGRFKDDQSAFGLFGEATWSLTPRLHLTAGLRYQHDRQTRTGALATPSEPIGLDYDRSFHAWLPKLSLAWDLSDDIRVGILALRAYNPGGTSLRFDTGAPDLYDAESLWDYELFARASFAGGKVTTSVNLFRYDIHDAQRSQPIMIVAPGGSTVTFADLFNVSRARSEGGELTLTWRPDASLSLRIGAGLLNTKITDADAPYVYLEGNKFQRSPRFTGNASIDWQPTRVLTLSAQVHHNSSFFSDDGNLQSRRVGGWTTADARAAWQLKHFQMFGYVRNILDDFHLTYLFNPTLATAGDPREFGVGVDARF